MRRRDLIVMLGGTAVALPLAVRAQQAQKIPRIGVLLFGAADNAIGAQYLAAFKEGLRDLGREDGVSVAIDVRWAGSDPDGLRRGAAALVALAPDVIYMLGSPAVMAARALTRTTPIVFANVSDPVGQGLVESLAHPGGNVTGFTNYESAMSGKWLALLKEIAPKVEHVALMFDPQVAPQSTLFLGSIAAAAPVVGVTTEAMPVHDGPEIGSAIARVSENLDYGLLVLPDAFTGQHPQEIIDAANRHRLPAIYPFSIFAGFGGLIAYGIDISDTIRRAAGYVDRILNGAKPSELPVQEPTKFTLALNLKTAKSLGVNIPPTLLALADEVIE